MRYDSGMTVKELLSKFPEDFMVDICTPLVRVGGMVKDIDINEHILGVMVHSWKVVNGAFGSCIIKVDC